MCWCIYFELDFESSGVSCPFVYESLVIRVSHCEHRQYFLGRFGTLVP
jgi:hypothetical protein